MLLFQFQENLREDQAIQNWTTTNKKTKLR